MSVSTNNQPYTDGGDAGGAGGDDEDDGVGGGACEEIDDSEEEGDHNKDCTKKKGKRVSCFRFRMVKRKLLRRRRKGVSVERRRCYFCLSKPRSSESGGESATSDPNSPTFTYEMLRVLIEKNDFYSKECNPHVDVQSKPCS